MKSKNKTRRPRRLTVPETPLIRKATDIVQRLHQAGHEALFAGGCVRDWMLGRDVSDIDIATSARPEEVEKLFERTVAVGKAFGVINVVISGGSFEVATFRKDQGYSDGRRPDAISFCSAKEDARRRDITINGMFYDVETGNVIDYVDGTRDLEAGIVNAIGNPGLRFKEDRLRMLRAIRFATTLGFEMDSDTFSAIQQQAEGILNVSAERIGKELTRTLCEARQAGQAIVQLDKAGLLNHILPEIVALKGCEQPPEFHPEGDVWTHTTLMLNNMPTSPSPALAYGVLLHDVGKPPTASVGSWPDGRPRIRFNRHAEVGAELAETIMQRLKLSRKLTERAVALIRHHMTIADTPKMRRSKLRRVIGRETFDEELQLHKLDTESSHRDDSILIFLKEAQTEFENEPVLPKPWISGRDLLALGLAEGPLVGRLLKEAYDQQLSGTPSSRDALLAWVQSRLTTGDHVQGS